MSRQRFPALAQECFDRLDEATKDLAFAIAYATLAAQTPTYSVPLVDAQGVIIPDSQQQFTQQEINLGVSCGANGILEFQLIDDGGSVYASKPVVAGEFVRGHFKKFGPNTTCMPLGWGNMQ